MSKDPIGGPAFPVLTRSNPAIHSTHEQMQVVPRRFSQKAGPNLALPEALSVPANAHEFIEARQNDSNLRRARGSGCVAERTKMPNMLPKNELAGSGWARHGCHHTARQEWRAQTPLPIMQHSPRWNAGRHILSTSSRESMVSKMHQDASVFSIQHGCLKGFKIEDILQAVRSPNAKILVKKQQGLIQ